MVGQESVLSVLGPHARSIGALKALMQGVLSQKPWLRDPFTPRKGWDESGYALTEHGRGKELCFGILWDNGDIVPHPPITRGLEMTKKALLVLN